MSDPNRYLDLVRTQTVFDGAMGTQIQDAKLTTRPTAAIRATTTT